MRSLFPAKSSVMGRRTKKQIRNIRSVSFLDLVPTTEPTMAAAMNAVIRRLIGIMNRFLRYQGRLVSAKKIKNKASRK